MFTIDEVRTVLLGLNMDASVVLDTLQQQSSVRRRCVLSSSMPFGKFQGKTLVEISNLGDEGLKYLKWIVKGAVDDTTKENWMKEKFTDIYNEAIELLQ